MAAGETFTFNTTGSIPAGSTITSVSLRVAGDTLGTSWRADISAQINDPDGGAVDTGNFGFANSSGAFNGSRTAGGNITGSAVGTFTVVVFDTFQDNGAGDDANLSDVELTVNYSTPVPPATPGTSIAINFTEGGAAEQLGLAEEAGVVLQDNWNNVSTNSGTQGSLRDDNGFVTSASVTWNVANTWRIGGTPGDENAKLMKSYLDTGDDGTATVDVTNIPWTYYDVIIYYDGDVVDREVDYAANGNTADPVFETAANWPIDAGGGNFVEAVSPGAGNYVRFNGLTGTLNVIAAQTHVRGPVNGVQIIEGVKPDDILVRIFDDRYWDGRYNPDVDTNLITGVTVTAYDTSGNSLVGTDNGDGTYSFRTDGVLVGTDLRVEVDDSTLPAGMFAGQIGGGPPLAPFMNVVDISSGQVRLDIPVQTPKTECTVANDLDLYTTCFVGGPRDSTTPAPFLTPTGSTVSLIPAEAGAVVAFARASAGTGPVAQNRYLATISEVGSTYGIAFQESENRLYVGAYAKRHAEMGPDGFGAVYVVDAGGGGVVESFTIPGAGSVAQGVDATGTATTGSNGGWLRDSNMFDAVGKTALGDVDTNDTEDIIWTVNLNNRHLYMVDVADPMAAGYGTVTDLGEITNPACPGNPAIDWRPFALEWHDGDLYVGGVCTGQSTQAAADIEIHIFRVNNPTNASTISFTQVFDSGPLTYDRGETSIDWKPWVTTWDINQIALYAGFGRVLPQVMLTDFEFDNNNSLILGIRDRFGDQIGVNTQSPGTGVAGDLASDTNLYENISMGEILHAEFGGGAGGTDVSDASLGDWVLETDVSFTGPLNDDPNDSYTGLGEYYWRTSFGTIHPETAQGGLAFHPQWPDQIATTSQDPFDLRSGGTHFFFTKDDPDAANPDSSGVTPLVDESGASPYQNGVGAGGYIVYGGQSIAGEPTSLFGKANGLGDLEYACGITTQQIGDCVWLDENENGIRDPDEVPIVGVTVSLFVDFDENGIFDDLDGTPGADAIDTTVTNDQGCYFFFVRANTNYGLGFDLSTVASLDDKGGSPVVVANLAGTVSNVTGGEANDYNDSDLNTTIEGLPGIAVATSGIGETDHTSDAGFTTAPLVGIGNLVFIDENGDGLYTAGTDTPVEAVAVELYAAASGPGVGSPVATAVTGSGPSAGCYSFTVNAGDYIVHIPEEEFQGGGPLEGYLSIPGNSTDTQQLDDNLANQDNGVDNATPGTGGVSSVSINLAATQEPTGSTEGGKDGDGDNTDDSNIDYTVDFGFYQCSIGSLATSNITRNNQNTPSTADDTFSFDLTVSATGGSPSGWTSADPAATGSYGVATSFGPFPVSGGAVTISVVDADDSACTGQTVVAPPVVPEVSIGNLVFCDDNDNGLREGGELGLGDVVVQLRYDADGNGTIEGGELTPIATTTTASGTGIYSFTGYEAGNYQVVIPASNFATVLADKALSSTTTNTGDNGIDNDDNGSQTGGPRTEVTSPVVTLVANDEPGTGGGTSFDDTIDFGFLEAGYCIGDYVFVDVNDDGIQNSGDQPVVGATVALYDDSGDLVAIAETNLNGFYLFCSSAIDDDVDDADMGDDGLDFPEVVNDLSELIPNNTGGADKTFYVVVGNQGGSPQFNGSTFTANGQTLTLAQVDIGPDISDSDGVFGSPAGALTNVLYTTAIVPSGTNETEDLNYDFGLVPTYDYGDLPEGGSKDFPTAGTTAGERPRHQLGSGITLGSSVDSESDGQPNVGATGDGVDEDGFPLLPDLTPGSSYSVPFTATVPTSVTASVYLNAWIDYDCSGSFEASEQIADDLEVFDGANTVTFTVPSDATPGLAYSRFRLSTESGLGATGDAGDGEVEDYLVTILNPLGAIGNYVWLDEDSDGQQNPGEPGIPNVTVELYLDPDDSGPNLPVLQASTVTDTDGGYLFPDLAPGCYYVNVLDSSVPSSLSQTTLYTNGAGDFGNKDHSGSGYKIDLGSGEVNLTADFGYNDNPTDDVNNGINSAALGDKVWFDANQDGKKDSNEVGIVGVTLELFSAGADGLFGTVDDVSGGTRTTDANGCYLFDGLTPDAYVVKVTDTGSVLTGYTQTGDPDHFGTTGTDNDGETTVPVVLGPGDVFLNADFGYYSDKSVLGTIGDKIWLDANASGGDESTKGSEVGIPGVTVALIADTDKDGIIDAGEKVIATDTTDSAGCYLFEGLPVDADDEGYIVWVNDTDNVLSGLTPTYDKDGSLDDMSSVLLDTTDRVSLIEDFSYTAQAPRGSIGDTVWGDIDSSGGDQASQGAEPGLAGVTVDLCDESGNEIASTVTDGQGEYLFANLLFGTYTVKVDETTIPSGYDDSATYDATGVPDGESTVTITPADPHNRQQDFSYPPAVANDLASIGDKVFWDYDGLNGQNGSEPGIPGVRVSLTPPAIVDIGAGAGVSIITTTDENGCYLFTGLPDDIDPYTVTVLDPPAGATQTADPDGGNDDTSQEVLSADEHDRDQDFGYQPSGTLYSIGNTVWFDADNNGTEGDDPNEGGGEVGLPSVRVTLCSDGPDGALGTVDDVLVASTETDETGFYLFTGLPTDNYRVKVDITTLPAGVSNVSTFEEDSTLNNYSDVLALASDDDEQDFAYPPLGSIGDTVFFDANGNDAPDYGEGIPEALVRLCNADGTIVLAETTTDLNGRFLFTDLPAGTYQVKVDPNGDTVPSTLANTEDPDSADDDPDTGDETSTVTIGVGESNLAQDFGYQEPDGGAIGNLVWLDLDADGVYEPADGETPIPGVTVDLFRDSNNNGLLDEGEPLLGTTTTEGSINPSFGTDGNYCFDNLPDGNYIVEVSDRGGVLNGYWHSLGTTGTDNHSQQEAFGLTLSGADQKNADFGYYLDPAKVGNYVWFDTNDNGVQDSAEEGLDGVLLTLTITYPNNDTITLNTLTGDDLATTGVVEKGWYSFCGLLQDEDYNGDGQGAEPTYSITVTPPTGYDLTDTNVGSNTGNDDKVDSDENGVAAQPVQGSESVAQASDPLTEQVIASYDFGIAAAKGDTFADWVADNSTALGLDDNDTPGVPGGGSPGADNDEAAPGDNPDGDIYNNALEYALCLDPGSGVSGHGEFCLVKADDGTVSAQFMRREGGLSDVTYTLEGAVTLATPTVWTALASITPSVNTTDGDVPAGAEKVTYSNLETASELLTPPATSTPSGVVRLKIELGGETYYSKMFGWQCMGYNDYQCATFSNPFSEKPVFSGTFAATGTLTTATDGSGNVTLDVSDAANGTDLSTIVGSSGSHYLQITNGSLEGERFDILSGGVDVLTLVSDPNIFLDTDVETFNTSNGLPSDAELNGLSFEVIRYFTIDDQFDPETTYAGEEDSDPNDATRLLFYNNRRTIPGFEVLMLSGNSTANSKWVFTNDLVSLTDRGDLRLDPSMGNWIHPKSSGDSENPAATAPVDQFAFGMVADHDQAVALNEGYNLTGAMWPIDQSPAGTNGRNLTTAQGFDGGIDPDVATELLFWVGDCFIDENMGTYEEGYYNYMLLDGGGMQNWIDINDLVLANQDALLVMESHRAVLLKLLTGDSKVPHVYPKPAF